MVLPSVLRSSPLLVVFKVLVVLTATLLLLVVVTNVLTTPTTPRSDSPQFLVPGLRGRDWLLAVNSTYNNGSVHLNYTDHQSTSYGDLTSTGKVETEEENYTTPPTVPVSTRPYSERFSFIDGKFQVILADPTVNPIPGQVTWRHSLDNTTVCNATHPFILVVVPSALQNKNLREGIRNTWANPSLYARTGHRTVFVLGATSDSAMQDSVDEEAAKNKDIIQYNFADSYRNLTYKTISWLMWVGKHCPNVSFVAKVDDDAFINPFNLAKFLRQQVVKPATPFEKPSKEQMPNNAFNFIYGKLTKMTNGLLQKKEEHQMPPQATQYMYGRLETLSRPHRKGKWGVTQEEYPESHYPPILLGPSYIVGGGAVKKLLSYMPHTPFLWLEDVFSTGLVARAAGIPHVQLSQLFTSQLTNKLYRGDKIFLTECKACNKQTVWNNIMKYFKG